MNDFKGTKGKWKLKHSKSKDAFNIVGTQLGGNYKIAMIPYLVIPEMPQQSEREKKEAEANAKLIEAAPEMLDVIINLISDFNNLLGENPDFEYQEAGYLNHAKELINRVVL